MVAAGAAWVGVSTAAAAAYVASPITLGAVATLMGRTGLVMESQSKFIALYVEQSTQIDAVLIQTTIPVLVAVIVALRVELKLPAEGSAIFCDGLLKRPKRGV